jgi:Tol biopolymer transport system component
LVQNKEILDSWKEIAAYLGRSVKTCRRWEQELGLPVHRLEDSPKARVFAYPDELDRWIKSNQKSEETTALFNFKKSIVPTVVIGSLVVIIVILLNLINTTSENKTIVPLYKQLTFTGNASHPAISPDGKFISYVNRQSNKEQNVMIQDLSSGQSIKIFNGRNCYNLKWSPDGSELLLRDREQGSFVLSRLGGTPHRVRVGERHTWSHDGAQFARIRTAKKEIEIENKTSGERTSIPLEGTFTWIDDVDWSPAGNLLLFITSDVEEPYAIWTTTLDGTSQIKVLEDDVQIFSPRWSSNGDAIYYLRSKEQVKELWKIRVSSENGKSKGSPSLLLHGLKTGKCFDITRDGKKLLYSQELQFANLWRTTIEGEGKDLKIRTNKLTEGTLLNVSPSISPDRKTIAYSRGDNNKANIFLIPIQGGTLRQLTFLDSYNTNPVWSPNGEEIAFGSDQGGAYKVWKVKVSGGTLFQFVKSQLSGDTYSLAWAPGQHILYQRPDNRNFHILDSVTEKEILLVEDDSVGWMFDPRYSPDGKKVAVSWNRRQSRSLWIIPLDDSSKALFIKERITPTGWSSDGKWVYGAEQKEGSLKLLGIELESRKVEELVNIEIDLEKGTPDYYSICMTPDRRQFVFPVYQTHSDVWLVENFDPEIK